MNKVKKLVSNLGDKQKYVLYCVDLKQYLALGLKLKKIHRAIRFSQSQCLQKYIDLNTKLRAASLTEFEKNFFKLMNNAVFGKTMENIRNRVDVRLVTNEKQALKLIVKPNFDRRVIFSEHLAAIHMRKTKLKFDKPIYLGFTILDRSKTLMTDFVYGYLKPTYGDKATICYTDTDSIIYNVETQDVYKDINEHWQQWFDTSNYPSAHPSGIDASMNQKILGKFKDECAGKPMSEFVGLRPKMYAFKVGTQESKRAKGVKKCVVKNEMTFADYKTCLDMNRVRPCSH